MNKFLTYADLDSTFTAARFYFVSLSGEAVVRGNHAHKELEQLIFVTKGLVSFRVQTPDNYRDYLLSPTSGYLRLLAGFWRTYRAESDEAIMTVIASKKYNEDDYIRSWKEYEAWYATEK